MDEKASESFVSSKTDFITALVATFCSLGLARAQDVHVKLIEAGVNLDPGWTSRDAVLHLEQRTHMAKLLGAVICFAHSLAQPGSGWICTAAHFAYASQLC
jgi:hypothetical protein